MTRTIVGCVHVCVMQCAVVCCSDVVCGSAEWPGSSSCVCVCVLHVCALQWEGGWVGVGARRHVVRLYVCLYLCAFVSVCVCHLSALSHTHTHDRATTLVLVRSCSGASVRSCSCYCSCFQSISIPRAHDPSPMGPSRELRMILRHCNTLQHTATHCNTPHCNTLQHTATHCSTWRHTATRHTMLHHTARCCTTLQHVDEHCNTLQHNAQHSNNKCVSHTFALSSLHSQKHTHTGARITQVVQNNGKGQDRRQRILQNRQMP